MKPITDIPYLYHASEDRRSSTMNDSPYLRGLIKFLETGLEYLEVIKKVRDDQRA